MNRDELMTKYGQPRQVLDHGFVQLVDYMGDDKAVVDMARKSYGQGTKSVSDDETLLRYLMRNQHSGPFEGVTVKLVVKCPIFVARQLMRHRTGGYDEVSLRYSEAVDDFWLPDEMPTQSDDNKQGSGAPLEVTASECLRADFAKSYHDSYTTYKRAREANVSREVARAVLPLATYTEYFFVINLRNLLHFLKLRLDKHAQKESRAFAKAISQIVQDWLPQSWRAFTDYELEAVKLSRPEVEALKAILSASDFKADDFLEEFRRAGNTNKREGLEFVTKLKRLGAG